MKFFLDTANIEEIKRINALGLVDGVTTNPTIIAKEGRDFEEVIKAICAEVEGPVSAEVTGLTVHEMVEQARIIADWAENVVIKVPMTEAGLQATSILSQAGIKTNVTLIFTVSQGLLAAKAGATFISPFVGRLDDIGTSGIELVSKLRQVLDIYGLSSEIIAASIRNADHVEKASLAGAHIATIPPKLFPAMWSHPLTENGLEQFKQDWQAFKNKQ
jgi:transaldolase